MGTEDDRPAFLDAGGEVPVSTVHEHLEAAANELLEGLRRFPATTGPEAFASIADACRFSGRADLFDLCRRIAKEEGLIPAERGSLPGPKKTSADAVRDMAYLEGLDRG